jgi:NADPH-dependent 2,4-dienoyl-CoA reductase/sulfur reductase-like enzyme
MNTHWDAIVIGTGPAGMAAAATLAEGGARTLVLDEQPDPGGQIYRAIERNRANSQLGQILGADYLKGAELIDRLRASGAHLGLKTLVWRIDEDLGVWTRTDGAVGRHHASALIVATGAMERPVPVPGWTLPGVMAIGAMQILLKSAGMIPSDRLVLAGSGPLFYLYARQCLDAGVRDLTLLDTAPRHHMWAALPLLPRALSGEGWRYLTKGLQIVAALRRAKLSIYRGARHIAIEGGERAQAVRFTHRERALQVPCDMVGLHEGVIPHQQMTRSLNVAHDFDDTQVCFRPRRDVWGRTTRPAIFIAGDAGGIIGAEASVHDGTIAALAVLHDLGLLSREIRDTRFAAVNRARGAHLRVRPFLDVLYRPRREVLEPPDPTVICRCEGVSAGDVRDAASRGVVGPNQAKAFLRCGMGPCQGRLCGPTMTSVMARATGRSPQDAGYYRIRSPLKPITIGELASAADLSEKDARS